MTDTTVRYLPRSRAGGRASQPDVCLKFVVACILAAFHGRTPTQALARYANDDVILRLTQQASVARRLPRQGQVGQHSLRVSWINESVIEAVLIYKAADRIRPVALRMERDRGSWCACFVHLL